ncbi:MAG: hypothetical protein ABW252_18540 [Polyangiales bacterium]
MADQISGNNREDWQQTSENLRRAAADERRKSERLAGQLSREALQQFQRSIEGLLALPTAAALGIGSATLYAASFLERGFEVLQQSAEALRNGLVESRREFERQESDSDGRRLRERLEGPQNRAGEAHA